MSEMDDPAQIPKEASAPTASLPARMVNIYAAPGDVFEELRTSPPRVSNWLVPVILGAITGLISVWVMFAQPGVQQQIRDQQAAQFQKLVDEGKMKQEDADAMRDRMEGIGMTIGKIVGSAGAFIGSFAWLFMLTLILWLLAKFALKTEVSYMKLLEVAGLAGLIMLLGAIVNMLLIVVKGNMFANAGPGLLISDFDAKNHLHLVLSSINLFTIWYVGVLSLGLARMTGVSFVKSAVWLYGSWLAVRLGIIFSGLGSSGM